MNSILIVEDEIPISQVLKVYMQRANFEVVQAFDGEEAINKFHEVNPSLVILDVMLPKKNGWEILKEIRQESTCPVIMLTALGDVSYRLSGLNGGADDYIPKPFDAEEVVARVQAVLRRAPNDQEKIKKYGQLQINTMSHRVTLNNTEIELTPRDLSLLLFLAEHPNQTFTRDQLINNVWGWEYEGSDRAVDLAIKRLRKALQSWPESEGEIKTLRGLGYQLSAYKK
ncbi:response regulator transcription factor [Cytobacillus purgationiresistens]|uniref:DNA-binding response OmpR family regulator n=1 Tax=Cytobacillus purgationiresistens TaxID=863449 RepID=A0ABU0ANJ6_9BACI|nr:response regulator transcription factor [Cytobacillus purgationiresistens]MDQ0272866.1 DNA-binding response OmpR family regulator [Cytobacillus purgationiresistens]